VTQKEVEILTVLLYTVSELPNSMILGFALSCGTDFQQTMKNYF